MCTSFGWIARVEQKDLVCGYLQTSRLDMICWSQSGVCESVIETKLRGSVNVLARCAYALTFLQPGADYEVAVDWRWRRLGDSFWMYSTQTELQQLKQKTPRPLAQSTTKMPISMRPAFEKCFQVPARPAQPEKPRPLRILPEAQMNELAEKSSDHTFQAHGSKHRCWTAMRLASKIALFNCCIAECCSIPDYQSATIVVSGASSFVWA